MTTHLIPRLQVGSRLQVGLEWKPADLWVGAYWERRISHLVLNTYVPMQTLATWHLWICLVPCLPIHLVILPALTECTIHGDA